ncbi:MAG: ATP-binding cassette domain-containing protein [Gammaproteobacteria bacterium]|nr:ATP-binding cassette domain-containing protein [Gammaproteobacteria bacterium]
MADLQVRGLGFHNLPPLSFSLAAAELVVLSGPSGCGKSLLLRALADLDQNQGEVSLGQWQREQMSGPDWRRRLGLLPAEPHWWLNTPAEHMPEVSAESLAELGLPAEALGWQISRLSTGERQRLALLRLLANRPDALLLDEPTANLDQANSLRVEALVRRYASSTGAPVLWVSHDAEQRRRIADRQLLLDHSGIQEQPWT